MKTIKEWFESVENRIFRKVLLISYLNAISKFDTIKYSSLSNAVKYFFEVEGLYNKFKSSVFWFTVSNELRKYSNCTTFNTKYPIIQIEWLDENECIHCKTVEEINTLNIPIK
jgi:hypothetical protein